MKYFIAFSYSAYGDSGFGNTETHYFKKIEGIKDIQAIRKSIEKDMNLEENSVVIINFIELN